MRVRLSVLPGVVIAALAAVSLASSAQALQGGGAGSSGGAGTAGGGTVRAGTAGGGTAGATVAQPRGRAAGTVIVRTKQGPFEDSLFLSRLEIILSEASKVQLITHEIERLMKLVSDSGPRAKLFVRTQAPEVKSLQMHAADAVLNIHQLCNTASRREAYVGVELFGGKVPGASAEELRAAGVGPYPRIVKVESASPAARAGLVEGEVIVKVNGQDIRDIEFERFITRPGDKINLRVVNAGKERDVPLELGTNKTRNACDMVFDANVHRFFKFDSVAAAAFNVSPVQVQQDSSGRITIARSDSAGARRTYTIRMSARSAAPLAPSLMAGVRLSRSSYLGATFAEASAGYLERGGALKGGVMVLNVGPNTFAARGGIQPGDIVVRVGKQAVRNLEEIEKAIESEKSDSAVEFEVMREGKSRVIAIAPK